MDNRIKNSCAFPLLLLCLFSCNQEKQPLPTSADFLLLDSWVPHATRQSTLNIQPLRPLWASLDSPFEWSPVEASLTLEGTQKTIPFSELAFDTSSSWYATKTGLIYGILGPTTIAPFGIKEQKAAFVVDYYTGETVWSKILPLDSEWYLSIDTDPEYPTFLEKWETGKLDPKNPQNNERLCGVIRHVFTGEDFVSFDDNILAYSQGFLLSRNGQSFHIASKDGDVTPLPGGIERATGSRKSDCFALERPGEVEIIDSKGKHVEGIKCDFSVMGLWDHFLVAKDGKIIVCSFTQKGVSILSEFPSLPNLENFRWGDASYRTWKYAISTSIDGDWFTLQKFDFVHGGCGNMSCINSAASYIALNPFTGNCAEPLDLFVGAPYHMEDEYFPIRQFDDCVISAKNTEAIDFADFHDYPLYISRDGEGFSELKMIDYDSHYPGFHESTIIKKRQNL